MENPPSLLDGADVLAWTRSDVDCFYRMGNGTSSIPVAAMAICQYADRGPVYLFKCDSAWNVVQDWDCESIDDAKAMAAVHANDDNLNWISNAPIRGS